MRTSMNGWPLPWRRASRGSRPTPPPPSRRGRAVNAARTTARVYRGIVWIVVLVGLPFAAVLGPAPTPAEAEPVAEVAAAAPCIPVPGLTVCAPDGVPSPLDPLIGGLGDAAAGLFAGTMDRFAADMIAGGVSMLDWVWMSFAGATTPRLDSVETLHQGMLIIAAPLAILAYVTALAPSIVNGDVGGGVKSTVWLIAAAIGMASTRPVFEFVLETLNLLASGIVFDANARLGEWAESGGAALIAAVGVTNWVVLLVVAVIWLIGMIGIMLALAFGIYGTLAFYALTPILWAGAVNGATRGWAQAAVQKGIGAMLIKVAVAIGLNLVASVIARSTDTSDLVGMLQSMVLGGIGFIAVAFAPAALWSLSGLPVQDAISKGRALMSAASVPVKAAVTGAAVATVGVGAVGGSTGLLARLAQSGTSGGGKGNGGGDGGGSGSSGGYGSSTPNAVGGRGCGCEG